MSPTPAAPSSSPPPPFLMLALNQPLGRGTLIGTQAAAQLTGPQGTLTYQMGQLLERLGEEIRALLEIAPDAPPRRPTEWSLLTEHEHPGWPLVALAQPPTLSEAASARIARHLVTAHQVMDIQRARAWAQEPEGRDGTEPLLLALRNKVGTATLTWGILFAAIATIQTQHMILHSWGVLSAYVGLNTDLRTQAAAALLWALETRPDLIERPRELAARTLWANLTLLHGGLPCPSDPQHIRRLAQAMRTLPERTQGGPLPELPQLLAHLKELLPVLDLQQRRELAEALSLMRPTDPLEATSGLCAVNLPGQTAVWLRRASEVMLIASVLDSPVLDSTVLKSSVADSSGEVQVRAWRWRLPQRASGGVWAGPAR